MIVPAVDVNVVIAPVVEVNVVTVPVGVVIDGIVKASLEFINQEKFEFTVFINQM